VKNQIMSLILGTLLTATTPATAGLPEQMATLPGDWDCGSGRILRNERFSSNEIVTYRCERARYFSSNGFCAYDRTTIIRYDSRFGGFCNTADPYCENGLKASEYDSDLMLSYADPLLWYNFPYSGDSSACRRLR